MLVILYMSKRSKLHLSSHSNLALRTLANLVKTVRLEQGISQKELAERIGISRHTLMSIEKADHKVAIGAILEACTVLGIPLLAEDESQLSNLDKALANMATFLPMRSQGSKVKLDDSF